MEEGTKDAGKKNSISEIKIKQERLFEPMMILYPEVKYLSNTIIDIKM